MLVRNKPKRREGFIKTQSLKSIQFRKKLDLGELSQEFSAFQFPPFNSQFSPYNHIKAPQRLMTETLQGNIKTKRDLQFLLTNEKLRKNYFNHQTKIFHEDDKFAKNQLKNFSQLSPVCENKQKYQPYKHKILVEYEYSFHQTSLSDSKKCQNEEKKLLDSFCTVKAIQNPVKRIKQPNQDDKIQSDKSQFQKIPQQKQQSVYVLNKQSEEHSKSSNQIVARTKGGLSFDINLISFHYEKNQKKPKSGKYSKFEAKQRVKRKNKKEILRRRQLAKSYDKQARRKVFGK